MTELECLLKEYGNAWIMIAFDPVNKAWHSLSEKDAAMKSIAHSPISSHINTAFIERNNLTIRERNRRLTRKTLGFSKRKKLLISSLNIYFGIYHFVKTHKGLRTQIDQKERKWMQRTPMMAAGITDHVWTLSELINFRV